MTPTRPPLSVPAVFFATWGGSGYLPGMPGTWGSLATLPVAGALVWAAGPWALAVGTILISGLGLWATDGYRRRTNTHDPGPVVIDEAAGQCLACLAAGASPAAWALAFLLFRLFDVVKPWPVGWADRRVPGAAGVMLDDLLAGGYALVVLALLRLAGVLP